MATVFLSYSRKDHYFAELADSTLWVVAGFRSDPVNPEVKWRASDL
jgi:hypothetical protein